MGIVFWIIFSFFSFTCPLYYRVAIGLVIGLAIGLVLGACKNIASFVPILLNIDIVVRFLLSI